MRFNFKKHKDCLEDYMSLIMIRKHNIQLKKLEIQKKIDNLQQHITKVSQQHEWVLQQFSVPPDVQDQDILAAHHENVNNLRKLHKQELQSFQHIIQKHESAIEISNQSLQQINSELDSQHAELKRRLAKERGQQPAESLAKVD